MEGCWEKGEVVALWDEENPYRVALDIGNEVYAPVDGDNFIRL